MKEIFLTFLIFSLPWCVLSQDFLFQDYSFERDSYAKFINYDRNAGIPDTRVNDFAQDDRGFIWIATSGGLSRFDGYTFDNFFHNPGDSTSLPSDLVYSLAVDSDDRVWVGSSQGLARYNVTSNKFVQVLVEPLKKDSAGRLGVRGLLVDENGGLWVLLQNGAVYHKKQKADQFRFIIQLKSGESSYTQQGMVDDKKGKVWISAMFVDKLLCIDKKTLSTKIYTELPLVTPIYGMSKFLPNCAFVTTTDGSLFMSSAHGTLCRITEQMSMQPSGLGNIYTAITDSRDRLWLGGYSGGLFMIDRNEKTIVQYEVNGDEVYSLSHSQIIKLFADREDNIWIATSAGLSMLSSTRFKFRHLRHLSGVKRSIPSNRISAIHQSPDNTLWVGTENDGLFSIQGNQIEHFKYVRGDRSGIVSGNVTGITSAADGSVWISFWNGFGGGFNRLDPESKKIDRIDKPKGSYWNNDVRALPDGQLYLGCWGPGLFLMDPDSRKLTKAFFDFKFYSSKYFSYKGFIYGNMVRYDLSGQNSKAFLVSSASDYSTSLSTVLPNMKETEHYPELFDTASLVEYGYANSGFLYRYNYTTNKLAYIPWHGSQPSSMVASKGLLYVAGSDGLRVFDSCLKREFNEGFVSSSWPVKQLKVFRNNVFVLFGNRVERLNAGKFETVGFSLPENVEGNCFDIDKNGDFIVACQGKLFFKRKNKPAVQLTLDSDLVNTSFLQVNDIAFVGNRIAVGTNQGLVILEYHLLLPGSIQIDKRDLVYRSFNVLNLSTDESGKIFATTNNGLVSYDPLTRATEEFRYRTSTTAPWNTLISTMAPDSFDRLWIGTSQFGYIACYNIKTKQFKHYLKKGVASNQIVGSSIQSVCVDQQRRVWVGTEEAFMQLDETNSSFRVVKLWKDKTLPVSSITPDLNGKLWLGTIDGLFQFDPSADAVIRRFSINDGTQSNEFGRGSALLHDGRIVVSGLRGINIFNPDKLPTDTLPPSPLVVRMRVDTVLVHNAGAHSDLVFPYRKCDYELEFSAMKFANAEGASFSWLLEGYDKQWRHSSYGQHKVLYSNLWPGHYRLLLKAANADGYWSEAHVKLEFSVSPPFWLTWWFALFVFFGLVALLFVIYRWRISRLRFHQKVLERTVKQRTAEIAAKNEELKVQYESIQVKNEEILAQRDEIEAQRDQIESQRDEVMVQKETIVLQNKAITDSIEYARRIQQATLPLNELNCSGLLKNHFAFHRPRNIVSGDFYWASCREEALVVAVADCTGHGVPGAFMSMLGISFLNRIVNENHVIDPAAVLEALRKNVIDALHQSGRTYEAADGMDVSVITFYKGSKSMVFSGANAQALLINKGNPVVLKGDKMPVAFYDKMQPFVSHRYSVESGDTVYMFSDGYSDQFGGVKGGKLKIGNFRELLVNLSFEPFEKQLVSMEEHFARWKGSAEQVDDVTVIGLLID
ncbi:MAG: two-component regulator propeller domain-containing protein [Bacteroidales bacterium]|nr:two-component regulator propeller domain-containing protein [Bacteroidales bacterium]